jgi:homopolymeric O-antigen transport system permease protein
MSLTTTEGASELEAGAATPNTTRRNAEFSRPVAPSVPDKPLIIIERSRSWRPADLSELWAYRELLYFLIWRDVKVRYKQTLMGVLWVIIQPLAMILIFTLLFGRLAGLEHQTGGIPYPIFACAGLLPWTFFASAITTASNSLVGSTHLITKIYFPRLIIPAAAVAAGLVDLALAFVILAALMAYYGVGVTGSLLLFPVLIMLLVLLALGVGMLLAALHVKYRDIRHAVPFMIQLWMFASPVIYPTTLVPERWRWVLALNPMTGIIEAFRAVLFGSRIDWNLLAFAAAVTLALLIYSCFAFRRMEKSFADVI